MNTIIAFAGLPGSGKTTLCQRLCDRYGVARVDVDQCKRAIVNPKKVSKGVDPPEERWLYCQMATNHALEWFAAGAEMVAMDEVFPFHSVRVQQEELCAQHNVRIVWVEVRVASEVAESRLTKEREGHVLSPEEAKKVRRMCAEVFEVFPSEGVNHFVVHNDDGIDVDLLLAEILGSVQ